MTHGIGGHTAVLDGYPHLQDKMRQQFRDLRATGTLLNHLGVYSIMKATILQDEQDLGSEFPAFL